MRPNSIVLSYVQKKKKREQKSFNQSLIIIKIHEENMRNTLDSKERTRNRKNFPIFTDFLLISRPSKTNTIPKKKKKTLNAHLINKITLMSSIESIQIFVVDQSRYQCVSKDFKV